jgi:hypothetical protein
LPLVEADFIFGSRKQEAGMRGLAAIKFFLIRQAYPVPNQKFVNFNASLL